MRKFYLFLGVLALTLGLSLNSIAQISHGGTPPSISFKSAIDSTFDEISISPVNMALVKWEDSLRGGPLWAGRSLFISASMDNAGTWTSMPDGRKIWRLKISSAGAKALGVVYDKFYIPEGGQLFLYNAAKTQIIGSYTYENNTESGVFSTELIQGESVILEYVAPLVLGKKLAPSSQMGGTLDGDRIVKTGAAFPGALDKPRISISEIVYVYRDVPFLAQYDPAKSTGWNASGTCQVNINCPEGDAWQTQKKGVAEMFIKNGANWGWCTGTLVNTTNNSGLPYFLTADHCYGMPDAPAPDTEPYASAADLLAWQFYFKYEAPACPDPATEPTTYNTLTGCTFKANSPINGGSDFCLVLLQSAPPQSYNPYYNGWDRRNIAATSGVGIHHPKGDIKKISTYSTTAVAGTFNGGTGMTGQAGAHWNVAFVATPNGHSVTEGGSSGSPLFNQNGLQVGTLSGGNSTCTLPTGSNLYGQFYKHWDQMGAADNQRLKPWLDPAANGLTTVPGYDPNAGFPDFYGVPTTIYEGQTVNFTDITTAATSWLWEFEGGTPATSAIQNPSNIYYYQQGTYRVKLTTTTAVAGSKSIEKVGYITVQPGSPLTTFWCDNFSTVANWTMSNSGGYTDAWVITATAPTGANTASMGTIASTSGGNHALFDSDKLGVAGDNQWAHITTTTGVNCTAYGTVTLKFEDYYAKFVDSIYVSVSNDNFVTSSKYIVHPEVANNGVTGNPSFQYFDISNEASGKSNVKIRFTFRSTQDMSTQAGWAYAWMVDDVCLIGVAPGNDLPVPDFTATTSREISPGQSVNFQDLSAHPTSWLWNFEGGTPATSTLQNPSNIVYNTGGYHAVTLTATNQNGSISTTKTDYIHVFDGCSYDESNIQTDDNISAFYAPGTYWGYAPGHNGELITSYAERITNNNLTGQVKSLIVAVAEADSVGNGNEVLFTVWSDNAGVPGTVLTTKSVPVKSLIPGYLNTINFAPVTVSNAFFVGFQLTYPATKLDTFACYTATGAAGRTATAFVKDGANWVSYETKYGQNLSLYIVPEFCLAQSTDLPDADFVASQTEITPGTTISFTDQTIGGPAPTAWTWSLTGGSPASSTAQNPPTVTYSTEGLYNVSLTATNANGSNTEIKGGYIHVAPVSNVVYWNFPSNPDNATADGGIPANSAATISTWYGLTEAFTNAGFTTNCASNRYWSSTLTASPYGCDAWSATFTTAGYTNIKIRSRQKSSTDGPRDFEVYYAVNGGDFSFLASVPALTTDWTTGGILQTTQLPADCDNATSIEVVWYQTSDISVAGGTTATTGVNGYSYIDEIYVTGMACTTTPIAPGVITGLGTVCQGQTGVVYSVPTVTGATYYNWTLPAGATIVSGNYTNTITVDFAQNQVAGNITVQGENMCGTGPVSSAKVIIVNPVPVAPGIITGIQTVNNGQNGVNYSINAVSGASNYTWTVPSFATITSGATTVSMNVNYACPGDYGNISVHANNACGAGPESYAKTIAINCPPTTNFFASTSQTCPGGAVTFTDISTNSPTTWAWTFTGGTPATSTIEHPTVTYASAGTYTVTLTTSNAAGSDIETKTSYIVVAVPGVTFANVNENPAGACNGTSTANATGASPFTYLWSALDRSYSFTGSTNSLEASNNVILNNGVRNFTTAVSGIGNLDGVTYSFDKICMYITEARDQDLTLTLTSPTGTAVVLMPQGGVATGINIGTTTIPVCFKQSATNAITTGTAPFAVSPGPNWKPAGTETLASYHTGQNPNGTWTFNVKDGRNQGVDGALNNWSLYFTSHIVPSTQTATNLCTGNYTVTVTDANGCTASASTTITASASVTASISATTNASCFGGNNGSATVTAASGTPPYTYNWAPDGFTGDGTATYSALIAGTYTVTVTDNTAGTATASVTITAPSQLTTSISAKTNASCSFNADGSATVAGSGGTAPYTYDWAPNGHTGDGTVTYSALPVGTYTVTVTDNKLCTATNTAVITALNADAPVGVTIAASPAGAICAGQSVTFTATPTNGGTLPVYTWKVNGVAMPGTGSTYTTTALANGNIVTCVLASNATCATLSPATSNGITMTVNPLPTVSAVASPTTICNGSSSTLTASTATTFTWMPGSLSGTSITVSPTSTQTYTVTGTTAGCSASNTVTVTVTPTSAVGVSIVSSASTICTGTNVTFTATPANGGTTPAYQWILNGTNVGTSSTTYSNAALAQGDIVTCQLTSNVTCPTNNPATSNAINMTVNSALPASVSIAASPAGAICSGTNVTFTASPVNGGTTPSYQWKVNGTTVGGNSPTYSSNTLSNSNTVTCIMTSSESCATGSPTTSNTLTMTVNANNAVGVSIGASATTICSGTSVTFTPTPTNGGTSPAYDWRLNGISSGTGATFTSSALNNADAVSCVMTSNITCPTGNPATSNTINMVVNANLPVSVSLTPSATTICAGTSVTITATPTNGGTTPAYSWKLNGTGAGTGSTYTSTSLATGDIVTCTLTSNATCATGNPATSAPVTMTVNPVLPVSVSVAASATTICAGTSVTFTATPVNGGGTPAYQWKVNGGAVGIGATYTSTTLIQGDVVTCVLTSNATCPSGNPATSAPVTMTVNPILPVSVTIGASANNICAGTSVTFTATPVNGGSTPSYDWKVNGSSLGIASTYTSTTLAQGDNVTLTLSSNATCATGSPAVSNGITMIVSPSLPVSVSISTPSTTICAGASTVFTAVPTNGGTTPAYQWKVNGVNVGGNSPTYTTTTLGNTNIVTCQLTSDAGCATLNPATSNAITMTVNPIPTVSAAASQPTICNGASTTLTGTGATTYGWMPGALSGTTALVSPSATTTYTVTGTLSGCSASNTVTVTVNPTAAVSVGITASATTVCTGTNVTFTAVPVNGGTLPQYQWMLNGANVGTNSTTYTNAALANGDFVTCQLTSNATCPTNNPATSNTINMTVNSAMPASVSIAAAPSGAVCAGTNVTFTASPVNGGTPTYQWKVNGVGVGGNSATYSSSALTTGSTVTCTMTSSESCATGSPAGSNTITMTVNPNAAVSVAISASATTICQGTSVTFTAAPINGGASPAYEWLLNGSTIGSGTTFTSSSLANLDNVSCILTSNISCPTGNPATSNVVNMTVNPTLPVSVTINASATTICAGTNVTFNATPTNGGSTPGYSWKLNGSTVGTAASYNSSALAQGDLVTCVLTSNATCATGSPATSLPITMTVNPVLPVSLSISATATTVCATDWINFTVAPVNPGSSPDYTWYLNGAITGFGPTYANVGPENGQVIYCTLNSNALCASGNPATSNSITLTVNQAPAITLQPVGSTIGDGGNTSFSVNATGAGLNYQWKVSTDGGGTFNNIVAAGTNPVYSGWNTQTLNVSSVIAGNDGYKYNCIVSGTCAPVATSNEATLNVNNAAAITSHPANVSICAGANTSFSVVATGTITGYQWQLSTDGGVSFNNIVAAGSNPTFANWTTANLDVTAVTSGNNGYKVRCVVIGPVPPDAISNPATLTVNTAPAISAQPSPVTLCEGSNTSFTIGATGSITSYQWQVSTNGGSTFNDITSAGTAPVYSGWATPTLNLTGLVNTNNGNLFRCVVTGSCAPVATSNGVLLTVNPSLPAAVTISANPSGAVCSGTSVSFTATPVNGGITPAYQWYVGGSPAVTGATYTTSGLTDGQVVNCVMTSNATCATGSPASSNSVTMAVNPNLPVSVTIAASATTICAGTNVTFTATAVNGGTTPAYAWAINGVPTGSNNATFATAALTHGNIVSCTVTSSESCATGNPAASNNVTMTVNPNLPASISIAASPSGAICAGATVNFTATPVNSGSTPSYQWLVNGVGVATSTNYSTAGIANGDLVTCVMTSNATCATGTPATSNVLTMNVNPAAPVSLTIAATPTGTVCPGTNVAFTAMAVNGGTNPSYNWKLNGVATGITTVNYNSATLNNSDLVSCVMTSNATCATGSPATSNVITMSINPVAAATINISATPAGAICAGTPVTLTATPNNGGTSPTYQWVLNGVVAGTSATYSSSTLADDDQIICIMVSNAACATGNPAVSNPVVMEVNPVLAVGVSITANPAGAMCNGTNVTFTANAMDAGANPAYQWVVNGINVGANSDTYTANSLSTGDQVWCILTATAPCATLSPATSNIITMNITPTTPVSVSLVASPAGPVCEGSVLSFTATAVNGGTTPVYQWMVNGSIAGTNAATFASTSLANGDNVSCVVVSNAACPTGSPATSAPVSVTVNPNLPASLSIAASATTICSGNAVTFTATPVNGGLTPSYQWKVNGSNTATGAIYTTTTLSTLDIVTCVLTSSVACPTVNTATSNAITVVVNPNLPVSLSIAASPSGSVCAGTSVALTATPTNGGSTPAYQWYVGGAPVGIGATYTRPAPVDGEVVTCVLTSNATCATGSPALSNAVTMSVTPVLPVSASISASATTICSGTVVTFTAAPVNAGSTPTYVWAVNGTPMGTNSATFTTSTLANNNTVTCTVTSSESCTSGIQAVSNTLTMAVVTSLPASVSISANPTGAICTGSTVIFTAIPVNGGSNPAYQWRVNGIGVSTGSTYTSTGISNGDVVTCVMTSNAPCATGSPASSNVLTMSVNPSAPVSTTIAASPAGAICPGTVVTFTAIANNGGTSPAYQWMVNGNPTGVTSMTYSNSGLNNGDMVSCNVTSTATCATGSPAASNIIMMNVNAVVSANVNIAASPAGVICEGTPVTFTATPTNGGSNPFYQWLVNGVAVANGPLYANSNLTDNDQIICLMSSNAACVLGSTVTSNPLIMHVYPVISVGISIAASPAGTVCAGTEVTFTATPIDAGANPNYQWIVNGINVGPNSPTYTNSALSSGDEVRCIITATVPCATGSPATSGIITMNVTPTVPASISVSANPAGAVCANSEVTFTASPVNGGTTPAYQWMVNGSFAGNNSAIFTTTSLVNGDNVSCILTSSEACPTGSPATSAPIAMTVNPNMPVSISIASDATGAVCQGVNINFTASPVNGGISPSYQWMVNGVNAGSDSPLYSNSGLSDGDVITCQLTSSEACTVNSDALSNVINAEINISMPVSLVIEALPSNVICAGDEVTFSAIPVNSGLSPVYQWYLNGIPAGINASTFITTSLTDADAIMCELTSSEVCATGSPATSSTINMTVNQVPVAEAGTSVTTCSNVPQVLTASGGSGYAWSNGDEGQSITVNPQGSMTYYVTVSENGCSAIDFVDVLVLTAPSVNLGSDVTLCGYLSLTLDAGANMQTYAWSNGSSNQTLLVDSAAFGLGVATYSVNVTAFNGCQDADTIVVTIQSCAGVADADADFSISFYPNPVHGILNLALNGLLTSDVKLSILDMIGQVTYTETIKAYSGENTRQIDLSSYATGVYYLNIQSGDRSYVHKIIVN